MLVTENQLDAWVRQNSREAEGQLAELIFRLVATSCPHPNERRFPVADSIEQQGEDGLLDTEIGLPPFVPKGTSCWEWGAGVYPAVKATNDYRDRTKKTKATIRRKSTFIFVTPLSGRRG